MLKRSVVYWVAQNWEHEYDWTITMITLLMIHGVVVWNLWLQLMAGILNMLIKTLDKFSDNIIIVIIIIRQCFNIA